MLLVCPVLSASSLSLQAGTSSACSGSRTVPTSSLTAKMPSFDQNKAYAKQEEVFFDDGREIELLHFIYGKPNIDEIRGSPTKVLNAIDEFGRTTKYLMNVGEDKGRIVSETIAEVKPQTMVVPDSHISLSPDIG